MRWLASHALERGLSLLSLLTLATANQVLDLGALDQYTPLRNPPSTLPSNTVYSILLPGSSSDSGGTPLALQEQQCYRESWWPKHFDVHEGSVKEAAKVACGNELKSPEMAEKINELKLPKKMGKDSKAWEDVHMWGRTGMKLKMSVEWKDGCVLAGGVGEQEPRRPLGEGGVEGKDGCYELFYNDWKNCNNGGVGGYRQVGCLVYSFSPN